jgi:hypothetical protein
MAAHFIFAPWEGLCRRPLLTAMMVFSIGFIAAGLVIWRCMAGEPAGPAGKPIFLVLVTRESPPREVAVFRAQSTVIGMLG